MLDAAFVNYLDAVASDLHPLETLNRLFGIAVANQFHDAFAGRSMSIPRYPSPGHAISKAIGIEAAVALCKECGGAKFDIPTYRFRLALEMFQEGASAIQVAAAIGVTERWAYTMRKRLGFQTTAAKVTEMSASGLEDGDIAETLALSITMVRALRTREKRASQKPTTTTVEFYRKDRR